MVLETLLNARFQAGAEVISKGVPALKIQYRFDRSKKIMPYLRAALMDAKEPGWMFGPFIRSLRGVAASDRTGFGELQTHFLTETGGRETPSFATHTEEGPTYALTAYVGTVADGWKWAMTFGNKKYSSAGEANLDRAEMRARFLRSTRIVRQSC
jgi:hypothetical protein